MAGEKGLAAEKRDSVDVMTSNRLLASKTREISLESPYDRIADRAEVPEVARDGTYSRTWRRLLPMMLNLLTTQTLVAGSDCGLNRSAEKRSPGVYFAERGTGLRSLSTSGSATWVKGDANWNSKVTLGSDSSMTLRPTVTAAGDPAGTTTWTVTLTDNTGATASRAFTVTYVK